jgi:peptidoglycan biosynthesis protein MviN/MurJ (putative lipid II flippase)
MENLIMHLITVVTLIVMVFVIIGLPYLMGMVIDRIFNPGVLDHGPVTTWMIGAICLLFIGLFGAMIYVIYIDIFTYYTKP